MVDRIATLERTEPGDRSDGLSPAGDSALRDGHLHAGTANRAAANAASPEGLCGARRELAKSGRRIGQYRQPSTKALPAGAIAFLFDRVVPQLPPSRAAGSHR